MKLTHLVTTLTLSLATAGAALAQDTPITPAPTTPPAAGVATGGFGSKGQLVISGDLQFQLTRTSFSMGGSSSTSVLVQPSADYFVAPNISVGATLILGYSGASGPGTGSSTLIGLGARGGYSLQINEMLTFWPQLQLDYTRLSFDVAGTSTSGSQIGIGVFAPFLYHIVPHLFFGIGPAFRTELSSKVGSADAAKQTDLGLISVLGGYFDL